MTNDNIKGTRAVIRDMGQTIRVPDPVYSAAERIADREDVSMGSVVREWKEKADKFDQLEVRR